MKINILCGFVHYSAILGLFQQPPGECFAGDWMRCFKLLGERIMMRDFDRQMAELQIRAAILNRFKALGTPRTQRIG